MKNPDVVDSGFFLFFWWGKGAVFTALGGVFGYVWVSSSPKCRSALAWIRIVCARL